MIPQDEELGIDLRAMKTKIDAKLTKILALLNNAQYLAIQSDPEEIFERKQHQRTKIQPKQLFLKQNKQCSTMIPSQVPQTTNISDINFEDLINFYQTYQISSNKNNDKIRTERKISSSQNKFGLKKYGGGLSERNLVSDLTKMSGKVQNTKNLAYEQTLRKRKKQLSQQTKVPLRKNPVKAQMLEKLAIEVQKNYYKTRIESSNSYLVREKLVQRIARMQKNFKNK